MTLHDSTMDDEELANRDDQPRQRRPMNTLVFGESFGVPMEI